MISRTRSILAYLAALTLLLALAAGWGWHRGVIQPWLQAQVVSFYLRRIEPGLPFKIESAEVDATWSDFIDGKLTRLRLAVRWNRWRAHLDGPIEIARDSKSGLVGLEYLSSARVEPVSDSAKASPPFNLNLSVRLAQGFAQVSELTAIAQAAEFKWPLVGIDGKNLDFVADWRNQGAEIELTARELGWTSPSASDHAIQIKNLTASAKGPLSFNPFAAGPELEVALRVQDTEFLWGETYLDLPVWNLPLHGSLSLRDRQVSGARISVGSPERARIDARFSDAIDLDWNTQALSLPELFESAAKATASSSGPLAQVSKLGGQFRVRRGKVSSAGKARFPHDLRSPKLDLELNLDGADLDWPEKRLALRGVSFHVPYSSEKGASGAFSISRILFRKLEGKLDRTRFSYEPDGKVAIGSGNELPLHFKGLPLILRPLTGKAIYSNFDLATGASLASSDLPALAGMMCASTPLVPPATVSAEFPKISLTDEALEPEGKIVLKAFDGSLVVSDLGYSDYASESPELDFSAELSGMRLDELGNWLHFGKMDGLLEAYAKDVVLVGSIPLEYNFRIEAKPQNEKKVVFSSRAMRNVVRLVGGTDLEAQIPGLANNIMFGWVSRLFGGYNVDYAGISLYSREGSTLLETLDPPKILEKENGRHFILYGPRFKMPVQSRRYPVVMDATAIGSLAWYFTHELSKISKETDSEDATPKSLKSEEKKNEESPSDPDCDPTRR